MFSLYATLSTVVCGKQEKQRNVCLGSRIYIADYRTKIRLLAPRSFEFIYISFRIISVFLPPPSHTCIYLDR